ncbi:hypothetical protein TNCV_1767971 [Trichonephila clavipes]|nr:hypothetical protein TNCV_1767971 [Trichonephila clavipes]
MTTSFGDVFRFSEIDRRYNTLSSVESLDGGGRPRYPRVTSGSWVDWGFLTVSKAPLAMAKDKTSQYFKVARVLRNSVRLSYPHK